MVVRASAWPESRLAKFPAFVMVHGATANGWECLQTVPGNDRRVSRAGCTTTNGQPKIKNHKTGLNNRPMPKVLAIPTVPWGYLFSFRLAIAVGHRYTVSPIVHPLAGKFSAFPAGGGALCLIDSISLNVNLAKYRGVRFTPAVPKAGIVESPKAGLITHLDKYAFVCRNCTACNLL